MSVEATERAVVVIGHAYWEGAAKHTHIVACLEVDCSDEELGAAVRRGLEQYDEQEGPLDRSSALRALGVRSERQAVTEGSFASVRQDGERFTTDSWRRYRTSGWEWGESKDLGEVHDDAHLGSAAREALGRTRELSS